MTCLFCGPRYLLTIPELRNGKPMLDVVNLPLHVSNQQATKFQIAFEYGTFLCLPVPEDQSSDNRVSQSRHQSFDFEISTLLLRLPKIVDDLLFQPACGRGVKGQG
jgi:hypothetical protein